MSSINHVLDSFMYRQAMSKTLMSIITGGDSSNKGCFGRKTNLFRESGDFAGNRETWEIFREIWDIFGTLSKDLILHVIKQYIYSDMHPVYALYSMYFDTWKWLNSPWYEKTNQQRFEDIKEDIKLFIGLPKQPLLELSPPVLYFYKPLNKRFTIQLNKITSCLLCPVLTCCCVWSLCVLCPPSMAGKNWAITFNSHTLFPVDNI